MAIHKATLAKQLDSVIEYIYPKTTADIVEYDSSTSVYDKISGLDGSIANNATDITLLSTELNSLTDTVSEVSANVTTNATDIDSLESSVNSLNTSLSDLSEEVSTNALNIATNSERITAFTNLAEGSTTGDAELTDVRVGYTWGNSNTMSAYTYESAGEAVRQQVSSLSNEIIQAISKLYGDLRIAYRTFFDSTTIGSTGGAVYGNS